MTSTTTTPIAGGPLEWLDSPTAALLVAKFVSPSWSDPDVRDIGKAVKVLSAGLRVQWPDLPLTFDLRVQIERTAELLVDSIAETDGLCALIYRTTPVLGQMWGLREVNDQGTTKWTK